MIREWQDVVVAIIMYGGMLALIAKFVIRLRRESADEKKWRVEERAKRELVDAAKARETERRKRLRERDGEVDAIVARCILGRMAFEQLVEHMGPTLSANDVLSLKSWCDEHRLAASLNEDLWTEIAAVLNRGEAVKKDLVEWYLDDEMNFHGVCFDKADSILGIERHWAEVDEAERGWVEIETASGKFEPRHARYERIFLKVPGADRGYIYILTNPAMPGLVKVGWTKKDPTKRAASLSDHTGVPAAFEVAYSIIVGNCRLVERLTHERLNMHRSQRNREFFRLSVADAVLAIQSVIAETGAR